MDFEQNKMKFYERMNEDGKLIAPIDLHLDQTTELQLDRLNWVNIDNTPFRMKLTNSGDTAIISGKWSAQRPYLNGGPLAGNYVFSQMHFHWGSDAHEGSEHRTKGICYPLELHMLFFKARYLTQEAALKHSDGIVVVVYLVKVSQTTTHGLKWIVNHLEQIREPKTSIHLHPSPISSLVVPFTKDYLLYWGSMQTSRCTHTMMWLVSRAALGVTNEDLNSFRSLLNDKGIPMLKNFRGVNGPEGRFVFHVNPSSEMKNVLLPGTIDPPSQVVTVQYAFMPNLSQSKAQSIFCRGDESDNRSEKSYCSVKKAEKPKMCGSSQVKTSVVLNEKADEQKPPTKPRLSFKSRLPVPRKNLQSSIAPYFQRPESAPSSAKKQPSVTKKQETKFIPKTTIPRPIGRNAGRLGFLPASDQ